MSIEVIKEVHERLFDNGVPLISTSAIAENEFLLAGNLMVASSLQGDPPPCILKEWVYQYLVSGISEKLDLSGEGIASTEIKSFLNKVLWYKI